MLDINSLLKKIRTTFIGKIFFSLIILYFVVFLFLFVFQGFIFRTYYTSRTIKDVKSEIRQLKNQDTYENVRIEELLFSRSTQTITSIKPISLIQNNVDLLDLTVIEIEQDNDVHKILVPKSDNYLFSIGQDVSATAVLHNSDVFIPVYISVDGDSLIRSNLSDNQSYSNSVLNDIDFSTQYQLSGKIINVYDNTVSDNALNVLISNEVLNLISENYISIVDYDEGFYYYTYESNNKNSNLVFFSTIDIDGVPHLLISVYQMDHVEDIVKAAGTANVYMFIVVLLILVISSFIYSKEFSKPLLFINKATKELSNLNFDSPLISVDSVDEFSELAQNINILSINLKTTLYQLNEQNKQLIDTIEKEDKLEKSRRDFVSGMSHELKTPLAVIQASAEAIEKEIYSSDKDRKEALKLIQGEVSKTNNMIKSMMNVYKVDTPTYEQKWKQENLKSILDEINNSLSLLYKNSKIKVDINSENTFVICNKDRLETIITNLFTNAIKYTPENGQININLYNTNTDVIFSITNTGITISSDEQEKIFEPFYRVNKARSRQEGSTGLGLYIVDQALRQYNSKCELLSTKNSVTFKFKLKKVINPQD